MAKHFVIFIHGVNVRERLPKPLCRHDYSQAQSTTAGVFDTVVDQSGALPPNQLPPKLKQTTVSA